MKKEKVILVIPAFNEEKTIVPVILESKKYVDEILVIDDGSKDRTIEFSKKAGAIVIPNIINRGLGVTMRRAYQEALARGADIIVQTDADGQYTLSDIPRMIQIIKDNKADMVIASRFKGGIEQMPPGKVIGNKIGTFVTRLVSGYRTSDAQSGFRAMRRELIEEIKPTNKMTYVQEMIIRSAKEGWRIREIPSYFKKRGGDGKSRLIGNVFGYAKKAVMIIIRTMVDYHPFAFFGIPGLLFFSLGTGLGVYLLYEFFLYLNGVFVPNRTGTMTLSIFLMIMGILFFWMGLLADLINRRFKEMKR